MADIDPIELNDPQDNLVREYLSATLDGQTGRAEARFRQFLAEQEPTPVRHNPFRGPNRFRGWTLGLVGAALAASLAALWAGPSLRPITPPGTGAGAPPTVATPLNEPLLVEQDVRSQTFDDGTFMADDQTPVHVLRRRDFQRTRWFDQNRKLQGEQIVPQEHVVYVQMRTD